MGIGPPSHGLRPGRGRHPGHTDGGVATTYEEALHPAPGIHPRPGLKPSSFRATPLTFTSLALLKGRGVTFFTRTRVRLQHAFTIVGTGRVVFIGTPELFDAGAFPIEFAGGVAPTAFAGGATQLDYSSTSQVVTF